MHCHYSVAMYMIVLEVGTVVLLLFQDRGVVNLILFMDMGTLGVVGLLGLEHNLLKETERCFPQVDEVPVPLLGG